MGGTLEYKVGSNTTFIYGNNFSGYHWDYADPLENRPQDGEVGFLFHKWEYDNYVSYQNRVLGMWLAIISALGFAGVLFSLKNTKWGEE